MKCYSIWPGGPGLLEHDSFPFGGKDLFSRGRKSWFPGRVINPRFCLGKVDLLGFFHLRCLEQVSKNILPNHGNLYKIQGDFFSSLSTSRRIYLLRFGIFWGIQSLPNLSSPVAPGCSKRHLPTVRKVVTAGRENYYTFRPEEVGRNGK